MMDDDDPPWFPIKLYPFREDLQDPVSLIIMGPRVLLKDASDYCICGYGMKDTQGTIAFRTDTGYPMNYPVCFMYLT